MHVSVDKYATVLSVYQLTTLTSPSDDVLQLLLPLPLERVFELLLVMRQSTRPVNSPSNFLRRAIQEGWTPETFQVPINRKIQNYEQRFYESRGLSPAAARTKALQNQRDY